MTYEEAKRRIHVRSAMMIRGRPATKFWKNSTAFADIDNIVNDADKASKIWVEYDPADEDHNAIDW